MIYGISESDKFLSNRLGVYVVQSHFSTHRVLHGFIINGVTMTLLDNQLDYQPNCHRSHAEVFPAPETTCLRTYRNFPSKISNGNGY